MSHLNTVEVAILQSDLHRFNRIYAGYENQTFHKSIKRWCSWNFNANQEVSVDKNEIPAQKYHSVGKKAFQFGTSHVRMPQESWMLKKHNRININQKWMRNIIHIAVEFIHSKNDWYDNTVSIAARAWTSGNDTLGSLTNDTRSRV